MVVLVCLFSCSTPRPLDARVVDVDGPAQGSDGEAGPVRPPAQRRDRVHVLHVADPGFFPGPRPRCSSDIVRHRKLKETKAQL